MRALRYAFDEAIASLWRGRQSALLSTGTIAIALFVLGGFLLVTSNLQRLSAEWSRSAEVSVYLDDEVSASDRIGLERLLKADAVVTGVEFVSKEEAARRFKQAFADLAPTLDGLERNPLPASYEVRVRARTGTGGQVQQLVEQVRRAAGVVDVRYDREWLDRLVSAIGVIRGVGFALGALLTCAAALTIANVVRLALFIRRDELAIMQLVGAPRAFIRGPFIMEGLIQGGLGALVALALLAGAFLLVSARYLEPLAASAQLSTFRFLPLELCVALVLGGMAVGCLGGGVAAAGRT